MTKTAIRTRFRLEPERLESLLHGEMQALFRGEAPSGDPEAGGNRASLTEARALELLFPEDGDESLLSLVLSQGGYPLTIPGGLSGGRLVRGVHAEANRQGEIWNPALDLLAGDSSAHEFLSQAEIDDHPDLRSLAEIERIPAPFMADVPQSDLDALFSRTRLRRFLDLPVDKEEHWDPVAAESSFRFSTSPISTNGFEELILASSGGSRALLLAPHIEDIRDPEELTRLLRTFRSDAFRTMAALFTPVLPRAALGELARSPLALRALAYNPEARATLTHEDGAELLARMALRPSPGIDDRPIHERDLHVRTAAIDLVGILAANGAPPFSSELVQQLEREWARAREERESPLDDPQLGALRVADPGNTPDDLTGLVREGCYRSRLDALCHPSATPDVAWAAFTSPESTPDGGLGDRSQALRASPAWRAAPEAAKKSPVKAHQWRQGFFHELLDSRTLVTAEVGAMASSLDADEDLWHELLERFPSDSPEGPSLALSLARRDDVRGNPRIVSRLIAGRWTAGLEFLFETWDPEIWTKVAATAARHPEGFYALSVWLREEGSPPPGAELPEGFIPKMLDSRRKFERETALRLIGEGLGDESASPEALEEGGHPGWTEPREPLPPERTTFLP